MGDKNKTMMANGFSLNTNTRSGKVEVCRRGVILAFADSVEDGVAKAIEIAKAKGIRIPTLKGQAKD